MSESNGTTQAYYAILNGLAKTGTNATRKSSQSWIPGFISRFAKSDKSQNDDAIEMLSNTKAQGLPTESSTVGKNNRKKGKKCSVRNIKIIAIIAILLSVFYVMSVTILTYNLSSGVDQLTINKIQQNLNETSEKILSSINKMLSDTSKTVEVTLIDFMCGPIRETLGSIVQCCKQKQSDNSDYENNCNACIKKVGGVEHNKLKYCKELNKLSDIGDSRIQYLLSIYAN